MRPVPRTLLACALTFALGFAITAGIPAGWATFTKTTSAAGSVSTATLAAPTSLAVSVSGSGPTATVTLTWTATTSSWATGTRVFRGSVSGGPYAQIAQISGLGTVSFADSPAGGGTFYYVVEAYYSGNGAN